MTCHVMSSQSDPPSLITPNIAAHRATHLTSEQQKNVLSLKKKKQKLLITISKINKLTNHVKRSQVVRRDEQKRRCIHFEL